MKIFPVNFWLDMLFFRQGCEAATWFVPLPLMLIEQVFSPLERTK
jgi:hypothetical protein